MILRRLTQNLKQQNWTATAIELVILVLGVFLGLQVQEWSNQRQTQATADEYTSQLLVDFREELWFRTFLSEYYRNAGQNAERVLGDLDGSAVLDDEQFLVAAYRATQYIQWYPNRVTYAQMVATGTVDLIRDDRLRNQALLTFGSTLIADIRLEGAASEVRTHFRRAVPLAVQRNLAMVCGDRQVPRDDLSKLVDVLDYPCAPDLSPAQVAGAVHAIRAIDGLEDMLRLRVMQIDTRQVALRTTLERMRDIAPELGN